jgi:hypothetical protein
LSSCLRARAGLTSRAMNLADAFFVADANGNPPQQ